MELCAIYRTLLADADGLYDPSQYNDRLLLGLKGTMSEAELYILKSRLQQGMWNKAQRGELLNHAPIGYVRTPAGDFVIDPDEQVQSVVRVVLEQFTRRGSVSEQLTLLGPFPLMVLCDTLEVSRAGYYAWLAESVTSHQQRERELMPLVCDIFWQHKRRYGARRIAVELAARGEPCGVDRVAKLLKMQGLQAIQPQSYKPRTTYSQHTLGYNPNLPS